MYPEFFESGKFSDLALECHGRTFEVHKLILAFSSEYFAKVRKKAEKFFIVTNKKGVERRKNRK